MSNSRCFASLPSVAAAMGSLWVALSLQELTPRVPGAARGSALELQRRTLTFRTQVDCAGSWEGAVALRTSEGDRVYVDAASVAELRGQVLLVGSPTTVTRAVSDSAVVVHYRDVVGAMARPGDGLAVPVATPAPGHRVLWPKVAQGEGPAVDVVWGEADDTLVIPTVRRIRYARFDGHTWSDPETVVEGTSLSWFDGSSVVRYGTDLLTADGDNGPGNAKFLLMLRHGPHGWSVRRLLVDAWVAYVTLRAFTPARWIVAYVSTMHVVGHDSNSLFVRTSSDTGMSWSSPILVQRGGRSPVYDPRLLLPNDSTAYLVFRQSVGRDRSADSLVVAVSSNNGGTWTRLQSTSVPDGLLNPAAVIAPDGAVHVVYATGRQFSLGHQLWRHGRWVICASPTEPSRFSQRLAVVGGHLALVWGVTEALSEHSVAAVTLMATYR